MRLVIVMIMSLWMVILTNCSDINSRDSDKKSTLNKSQASNSTSFELSTKMTLIDADQYGKLETLNFTSANESTVHMNTQVLGISLNNESKAYPIYMMAYHHDIKDVIGKQPVWVNYCLRCRSGRVYDPMINDKKLDFNLVGLINNNVAYQDTRTNSIWLQEMGKSIRGEYEGTELKEIFSEQVSLKNWLLKYPDSKILQYDPKYVKWYQAAEKSFRLPDDISFRPREERSLIIGVDINGSAKAYDWEILKQEQIITDQLGNTNLILLNSPDTSSFFAYNRKVGDRILDFSLKNETLIDSSTGSVWNLMGTCISGELAGAQMDPIQAYQEIWQAWSTFHPQTTRY